MKNWLTISLILFLAILMTSDANSGMVNQVDAPTQVEIVSESATKLVVQFDFPRGEVKRISNNEGEDKLWFDQPGSIIDFEAEDAALPQITRLIAVPNGYTVRAKVLSRRNTIHDVSQIARRDGQIRNIRNTEQLPTVEVSEPVWIRWMRVASVVVRPAQYDNEANQITAAEEMEVEFEFAPDGQVNNEPPDPERYWSLTFETFFTGMLLNPSRLPDPIPGGSVVTRGSYLIITNDTLSKQAVTLEFAEWKRRKGFDVFISTMIEEDPTKEEIKEYIQNAYDNWERPPEFVLLVGDVNGTSMRLPAYRVLNPGYAREMDVSDLPYVLLEGDDYFPDAFIGRISTDSPNATTIRNYFQRVMDHEQHSETFDEEAFYRATIFAGNYSDSGPISTPVETSMWLAERLRELGWDVEEFYYNPPDPLEETNISDPIVESINCGVNIVSYRGWGDANGTHYPPFYKSDLDDLNNGPLLPVMTFFVCNSGDFGNDAVNPGFGEYTIDRGRRNTPAGALAFYGPSDLHTSTRYNNPMLAGYYSALMYRNIRTLGPLTLAAKIEVWRGFPHKRTMGGDDNFVDFYFHAYNILGDPEVNIYFDPPFINSADFPEEIPIGSTHIPFRVTRSNRSVTKAMVNLFKEGEVEVSVLTDHNGIANVPVNIREQGEIIVTILSHQSDPIQATIRVVPAENMIGFENVEISNDFGDDRLVTGSPVELTISLKNFGISTAQSVTATLRSELNAITIDNDEASFGDIEAGQVNQADQAFTITLEPRTWAWAYIPFYIDIEDNDGNSYTAQFRAETVSTGIKRMSHGFTNRFLNPGQTEDLILRIYNHGPLPLGATRAHMTSFDESVEIVDAESTFPALEPGESGHNMDDPFRLRAQDDVFNGRRVSLRATFYDNQDRMVSRLIFNITVGEVTETDPLGPDSYGYYAYENIDDERYGDLVPEYHWIELDPDYGGEADSLYVMDDDAVVSIELPFSFQYYGMEYDSLTICSNGWVCFDDTWMANFRNWGIPSPLGPHAMVAPYWEDLVMSSAIKDGLKIFTRFDDEEDRFIVEWSRVVARTSSGDSIETFEVILFDLPDDATPTGDDEILFQYFDVALVDRNETNYATVGIQDWLHFRGLEITFSAIYPEAIAELDEGRAILFSTRTPDNYLSRPDEIVDIPTDFALSEPYPNPFNATTTLRFSLPEQNVIAINLWDLNGRLVKSLLSDRFSAGWHSLTFNADDLSSGLYIVRMSTDDKFSQKKVMLLK